MRSVAIVVIREFGQHGPWVALVDHNPLVEAGGGALVAGPVRRLQELVPNPGRSRTGGDVEVINSRLVPRQEEDVKDPKAHRLHREQVGRLHAAQLIGQERSPALAPRRPQPPPAVVTDGTVAYQDAELQQLATDALGAREGILLRDPADERLQFRAETGSASRVRDFHVL